MSRAYTRDTADAAAPAKDIAITTTLGIAERLNQRIDDYMNAGDGLITQEVIRLTSQNETTVEKIAALESRLLIYQNMLISKYAAMEQAIARAQRSEEHTSELQSLMRISYAVFCLKKKTQ